MRSTMGSMPLSVAMVLRRAAATGPHARLVGLTAAGRGVRTWPQLAERARRLAAALPTLGVAPGDRVGTFACNSLRHLELFYGVPIAGAVLQPLNVRLFPDQIAWIAAHAEDRVVFVEAALTARLAEIRPQLTGVRRYVVMPDGTEPHPDFADAVDYEELIAGAPDEEPVEVDEWAAACLCYTGGTTGRPKGVVYSHRSLTLHAMSGLFADSFAIRESDVLLPLTPLFHATSWGMPYSAALAGAGLVLAGMDTSPQAVLRLVREERVTVAAGVPTFWLAVDQLGPGADDLGTLRRILCGGSAIPLELIQRYHRRGVDMQQGWGMTEMSPSGSLTVVRGHLADRPEAERLALHATQGFATAGVELRIVAPDGEVLPHDGVSPGEIEARGPWVTEAYHRPDDDANETRFRDGWLRTGDVGTIDPDGYLHLLDRDKDLVKSGGEWISSIDLENHLMDHDAVAQAMVIAVPHPVWGERPAALVVTCAEVDAETLRAHLRSRVASWWVPDVVEFVADLPTTATGKFDKKRARALWQDRLAALTPNGGKS
ncbi:long-chain-fatty-acid--CoA ligase [Micromonospora sp. WMMD1102]|uniref:long-chain-fatty-acid--CoA ligase n=1 Tax=Micromonospora sp. WMMD1102 TaxID=3016105 RepID=UPI0024150B90|nr:long-chain-fatty-acid--CoA ligase [Micromonospora sp. WMMD1102]MDG4785339.1 long-chain-fatty-acid--CoA ligase [Micromonospora sp. WMMD1102]